MVCTGMGEGDIRFDVLLLACTLRGSLQSIQSRPPPPLLLPILDCFWSQRAKRRTGRRRGGGEQVRIMKERLFLACFSWPRRCCACSTPPWSRSQPRPRSPSTSSPSTAALGLWALCCPVSLCPHVSLFVKPQASTGLRHPSSNHCHT